jgi:hypothetical protein
MSGEPRQPGYVDLSDEQAVRFGGECGICSARYATQGVSIRGVGGGPLRELRKSALTQFDSAWRDLQVRCNRCGRGACPECWDVDNRMCAECADAHGLARASYAPPTRGPLADGRLTLAERGKYSRLEQPAWMGSLIASGRSGASLGNATSAEPWMLTPPTTGDIARGVPPKPPLVTQAGAPADGEPTVQTPTMSNSQPLPPPTLPPDGGRSFTNSVAAPGGPGAASSGMIACPRCGTANFDFVTLCTACQLQLVQICPNCERLNPGQAERCDACGSLLARQRGWSGALQPLSHDVAAAMWGVGDPHGGATKSATSPPPQVTSQIADVHAGTASTRIVPYVPSTRRMLSSGPTYTPGGVASGGVTSGGVTSGGVTSADAASPTRERGQRRRPTLTAYAGMAGTDADAGGTGLPPLLTPMEHVGAAGKVGAVLDRISGWILVAVVVVVVGMVAAAELSPGADAALRGIIHIDIRQTLANFGHQIQMLWQRIHS